VAGAAVRVTGSGGRLEWRALTPLLLRASLCRCIKTVHTCDKGLTLSGKKCCESCPANCHQEGAFCYAP
jgi:hypothetical protein